MIPKIKRCTEREELMFGAKWKVVAKHQIKSSDLCNDLGTAIRFWFWHIGVSPKICFRHIKKYENRK